jgi:ankyrin repeat protein
LVYWLTSAAIMMVVSCSPKQAPSDRFAEAVMKGDKFTVSSLLETTPSLAHWKSPEIGLTALHLAARNGRMEVAELLLAKGADVNAATSYGETPLYTAASNCRGEFVKLLLAKGANVNARSLAGTPLKAARQNSCEETMLILQQHGGTE